MPERVSPEAERDRHGFGFLPVAVAVIAAGTLVYGWTLRLSFAYDDVDLLNQSADVLAGRLAWTDLVLRPHGDHLIPVLRLLFLAQASLFGVDALPLRLVLLAAHLATALVLGAVARRYAPGPVTLVAAVSYVGTAGLSSQLVWQPIGGSTPLALLAFTVALWAVVNRSRLGALRAEGLAAAALTFAVVCANTLFPMAAGPIIVNEWERRRSEGRRLLAPLTVAGLGVTGAVVAASVWIAYRQAGFAHTLPFREAIPRALFLLSVAPFRAVFPFRSLPAGLAWPSSFPWAACLAGLGLMALAACLAVRWGGPESRALLRVAGFVGVGSAGVLLLVGLGRSAVAYADLYYSDRYFQSLAPSLALLAGSLGLALRRRTLAWSRRARLFLTALVLVLVVVHLSFQRVAVSHLVNHPLYEAHGRRFASLVRLMDRLGTAAQSTPLVLPDGAIALADIHNRRITTRTLLYVVRRSRTADLVLGDAVVGPADESRLNSLLDAWAESEGESRPFLAVREGRLVNLREAGVVDFRVDSGADRVVRGLLEWDGTSRWMTSGAEIRLILSGSRLRLILALPWGAIRARTPDFAPLEVEASLVGERDRVRVGRVSLAREGLETASFTVPPDFLAHNRGRSVVVRLEASRTWRPVDVLSGNPDPRELSALLYLAGFED